MREKSRKGFFLAAGFVIVGSISLGGCPGGSAGNQPQPSGYDIVLPSNVEAGSKFDVTVRAVNAGDVTVPSYIGTIHFTSSDPQAALPADYTFTIADKGSHTFTALTTLKTSGYQTVTVSGTTGPQITSSMETIVLGDGLASFQFGIPVTTTNSGQFVTMVVTARDSYGNTISTYTGDVSFTSTDVLATLPGTYGFDPAVDKGTHTFVGLFVTNGTQTVCVADVSKKISTCGNVWVRTSLYFVDGGLNPTTVATILSPQTTTTLTGYLVIDGTPTSGKTIGMAVTSGSSAVLSSVTDIGGGSYTVGTTDPVSEEVTVLATESVSGAKGAMEVQFISITVSAVTGTTIEAGNGVTITAVVKGISPATGRTVQLTTDTGNPSPVGAGPVTMTDKGNGSYSISGITDIPETVTFTATDSATGLFASVTVTFL